MPFEYAKISGESIEYSEDAFNEQKPRTDRHRFTMWTGKLAKLNTLRWPVALVLLIAILVCELAVLVSQLQGLQIGEEANGLVPRFSLEKRIYRTDTRFASDHKTMQSINATRQNWIDLMPRGGGFLEVPNYSHYSLPPPMHFAAAPGKEIFTIAVFHEMHCLMHLSAYLDKLVMQIRNKDWIIDEGALWHNDHCFNYLRNALICAADTTLEGQSQSEMLKHVPGTDGTGAVHSCRNFDEVYAWAEKKRVTDRKEHL